jgi:sec-independent protein translocase protein TatA
MNPMLAMLNGWEIVMILAIVLILFGAKKLPELARGLGQGIKEFKKASREMQTEIESAIDMDSPPPPAPKRLPDETQARTTDTAAQPTPEQRA